MSKENDVEEFLISKYPMALSVRDVADHMDISITMARIYIGKLRRRQLIEITDDGGYRYKDQLKTIQFDDDLVAEYFKDLQTYAEELRSGEVNGIEAEIEILRIEIAEIYSECSIRAKEFKSLLDNYDLWNRKTLVNRLGFNNSE